MTEVFLKIVNMSISATWLVLAVLALRLVLKKAPKWVNVLLWGIVAVRLICPFSIESALSLIPSTETISPEIMMDWTPEISTGIEPLDQVVNPIITESFAPQPIASANPLQILIPVWANLWVLGILILTLYTLFSYWHLRHKVREAIPFRDNIFQCATVNSPFVLGIIKPKIYLPFGINEADMAHVVAHEQAHIRRRDHWWKPLGFLLLTIHWFNPLMWLAYVLLCRDIELACDEKVIKELGNEHRADYTHALVACSVNRRMIAACPLAFGEVGVKERVKSIMNYRKPTFWIMVIAILLCVVVAVCFLTDPVESSASKPFRIMSFLTDSKQETIVNAFNEKNKEITLTVDFESTQGPSEIEVIVGCLLNDEWVYSREVELALGASAEFLVPAHTHFTILATALGEKKGNVTFVISEDDDNSISAAVQSWFDDGSSVAPDNIAFGFYDLEGENAGITEIKIRNLHNGQDTFLTDEQSIESILSFLSRVQGANRTSSKGYYGGSYEVQIMMGSNVMLSIGFGDDDSFNCGDYGDGYPARYDLRGITREDVLRFLSQYDTSGFNWDLDIYSLPEVKWFDYTEDPSDMSYETELRIRLGDFPGITFKYNPYGIVAATEDSTSSTETMLISGLPVWSAYFCDLTGDDKPEICSQVSYGSSIIDSRVIVFDYANGVSYTLEDRGYHDYYLRMDGPYLCVDKRVYNSDELVFSGRLIFRDGCIQIDSSLDTGVSSLEEKYPEYYGLDTSNGLDLYVWQMAQNSYSFGVLPHTDTQRNWISDELMNLRGTDAREMRLILVSYGIDESDIHIIPWQNPYSSYIADIWIIDDGVSQEDKQEKYIEQIHNMLFGIQMDSLIFDSPIYDSIIFDIDGDGRDENCVLSHGRTSGVFTFALSAREDGMDQPEYATVFLTEWYDLSFVLCDDGIVRVQGIDQAEEPQTHLFDISIMDGNLRLTEDGLDIGSLHEFN